MGTEERNQSLIICPKNLLKEIIQVTTFVFVERKNAPITVRKMRGKKSTISHIIIEEILLGNYKRHFYGYEEKC